MMHLRSKYLYYAHPKEWQHTLFHTRYALFHVKQARTNLERGFGAEIVSEDVRLAAQKLGALVGRIDVEDILGEVFSSFCIGK